MGAWGTGLYCDDVAQDIKDDYIEQLKTGKTDEEALKYIIESNKYLLDDEDDGPVFWFALADTLWNLGRLDDFVKEKAMYYLNEGGNLRKWKLENPKESIKREKVLNDLYNKLNTIQPEKKRISKRKLYKCEWKIGDVFAYPLLSNEAKDNGLYGRYIILIKVGEVTWYPGHVIPIVRIKITKDNQLPNSAEEIDMLEYVQISIDFKNRCDKQLYKQYGGNPIYQCILYTTSKKVIPRNIVYINNYSNLKLPEIEFVNFVSNDEIPFKSWANLEDYVIKKYLGYNLKQFLFLKE